MLRFYDPNDGAIYIDGKNIKDISQVSLRKNIGIVPQDTVLFNDTISYNLKYGKIGSSDKEIWKVAEQAQLSNLIKTFPEGMNTVVGERGLKLSGGEKQRVAIARAIINKPNLILADEPTGNLDEKNSKDIFKTLLKLKNKDTTIIYATHNLYFAKMADYKLKIRDGRLKVYNA